MTNTTMTASIMMVRLTASTSKSSFMMRLPQALRLLRLFKVEPSRSPSLLHHLRNHHRPHNHWDKKVSLHCPAFCQTHNHQHRQQPLSSIMMVTFCEAPAAQDLFGEGTTAPPRNPVFHLYFPVSFKIRNGLKSFVTFFFCFFWEGGGGSPKSILGNSRLLRLSGLSGLRGCRGC